MDSRIDFERIKRIITNKKTLTIIALLACLLLSFYMRSSTANLPGLRSWAVSSLDSQISNQIMVSIEQQFPNLPIANKEVLLEQQKKVFYEENIDEIEQQTTLLEEYFRSKYQDDEGQTYLLELDPYQHLRRAENLQKYGSLGEAEKDGKPYTYYQFSPRGKIITEEIHPYIIFYSHKIMSIIDRDVRMIEVEFWIPAIISSLCVIPAFFIVKKKAGIIGGLTAGIIIAIHPSFLARTVAGFSDTDAYTILFPLLITWIFLESTYTKNLTKKIILGITAGITTGIFAFAWPAGWWYIFDLIIGTIIIYIAYQLIKNFINKKPLISENIKKTFLILIIYSLITIISVPLMSNEDITSAITQPIMRSQTQNAAYQDYWPNIQTTVAELGSRGIGDVINQLGSNLLFLIALAGIIISLSTNNKKGYYYLLLALPITIIFITPRILRLGVIEYLLMISIPIIIGFLINLKEEQEEDKTHIILLSLWLIASLFATTHGTRFLLVTVPAAALTAGIGLSLIHKKTTKIINDFIKKDTIITSTIILITLMIILFSSIFRLAEQVRINQTPLIDDTWVELLTTIKEVSEPKAIINSWWDYGHWFAYWADRGVTVDGGGQENHLAYWMGTVLLTNNETEAINTLRMLDCASFEAYDLLNEKTFNDYVKSTKIINTIIHQSKEEALQTMKDYDVKDPAEVLEMVFCKPPENYLITSEDMVGKAPVWAHFGAWDFERAYAWLERKKETPEGLKERLGISQEIAEEYYSKAITMINEQEANTWISPWPQYITQRWIGCELKEGIITCEVNRVVGQDSQQIITLQRMVINKEDPLNNTLIATSQSIGGINQGILIPQGIVIAGEELIRYERKEGITLPVDIIIDLENNRILITDPLLSTSMFTRLFYLEGRYNERFQKITEGTTITGEKVIVWKVLWN